MDNLLRKIESDEFLIYTEQVYSTELLGKCREIHKRLVEEKKLEGCFDSEKWLGSTGVRKCWLDFHLNKDDYQAHIGKEFGISVTTMQNMLRCYVIYCYGIFIYRTISGIRLMAIKAFLHRYKDSDYRVAPTDIPILKDFLYFIGTPVNQMDQILSHIRFAKGVRPEQRALSPIINYLVIENEVNRIYRSNCDDAVFKKWFPIYFWVNITFILPLRSTEMLLTPKHCISRENEKVFLTVRRTQLKKRHRTVYCDINKDYKKFVYEIPDTEVVRNIEKYIELTESQDRRFLFEYTDLMLNNMLSLQVFNRLIADFMQEHIICNSNYDFAKYASGITEFEFVTAGDSRPIAMANLYFQKSGEDICRQLADHIKIDTSAHYYTNISDTIWASSIIQLQRKLEYAQRQSDTQYVQGSTLAISTEKSVCASPKRLENEENLDDCVEQGHLADCMGCKYYRPSKAELDSFMQSQKKKVDDSAKRVIDFMNYGMKLKNQTTTLEEVFLSVQTDATRYRIGCNIKAEEKYTEWERNRNSQKINC